MALDEFVQRICDKSPLQKKRLVAYLATQDEVFFRDAEKFAIRYGEFLKERGISIDYAIDAYLNMCRSMLRFQIQYMRTGRYPVVSAEQAKQTVYESESQMLPYMVGLGLSQFLWPTHYQIFDFFCQHLRERADVISSYLEVGPGHGLMLEKALCVISKLYIAVAIDISATSLTLTRSVIEHFVPEVKTLRFVHGDILETDLGRKFDFITLGEVMEHVDRPQALLARLREMLASDGRIFVSTCANCPAIDHVYQFDTVGEIRVLIESCDLHIENDLTLPVEDMSLAEAERRRVTINYCALLR